MKRSNIIIELTPLLDVILVVLFMILVQGEGRAATAENQAQDARVAYRQALDEERETLERAFAEERAALRSEWEATQAQFMERFDAEWADLQDAARRQAILEFQALLQGLEEGATVIVVRMDIDPTNPHQRGLIVEAAGRHKTITLSWDEYEEAAVALHDMLYDIVGKGNDVTFIVFQYDGTQTFVNDRNLVRQTVLALRAYNPRILSAEIDIRSG